MNLKCFLVGQVLHHNLHYNYISQADAEFSPLCELVIKISILSYLNRIKDIDTLNKDAEFYIAYNM